ncbi:MAG: hypothetical protein NZ518_06685 [Dehalococcoidia bacterium]|nr:hypothetical protein [Dehalococcoidia bacterium]
MPYTLVENTPSFFQGFARRALHNLRFFDANNAKYYADRASATKLYEVTHLLYGLPGVLAVMPPPIWRRLERVAWTDLPETARPFALTPTAPSLRRLLELVRDDLGRCPMMVDDAGHIASVVMTLADGDDVIWRESLSTAALRVLFEWLLVGIVEGTLIPTSEQPTAV